MSFTGLSKHSQPPLSPFVMRYIALKSFIFTVLFTSRQRSALLRFYLLLAMIISVLSRPHSSIRPHVFKISQNLQRTLELIQRSLIFSGRLSKMLPTVGPKNRFQCADHQMMITFETNASDSFIFHFQMTTSRFTDISQFTFDQSKLDFDTPRSKS